MALQTEAVIENLIDKGVSKAERALVKMLILSMMAGAYIAFAGLLATTSSIGWSHDGKEVLYGLSKILFGAVFSTGLMLVLIPGGELFTGNILMTYSLLERKISLNAMLKNWLFVWVGNFAGALFLAWVIAGPAGLMEGKAGEAAMKIAQGKSALTGVEIFTRAVLANWIVCLAVMMCQSAKDTTGKILAIFFPIMGFAAVGFEHSIANMYFIPIGLMTKASQNADALYPALTAARGLKNILIATAGNILGGMIPVAAAYYFIHKEERES